METSRRHELLKLASVAPGPTIAHRLCILSLESAMDGAAILLHRDSAPTAVAATAGPRGSDLAQLELTLGEGPGHQALGTRIPVFADQILTGLCERWPVFAAQARSHGLGAIFALPLCLGSICVGVLETCRIAPGRLTVPELTDLSHIASLATSALLLMQAGLDEGDMFDLLEKSDQAQLRVHQASGMVAQQASVSLADALALIRGHALTNDQSLAEVAEGIITRKIRMDGT